MYRNIVRDWDMEFKQSFVGTNVVGFLFITTLLISGCGSFVQRAPTPTPFIPSTAAVNQVKTYEVDRGKLSAFETFTGRVALAVKQDIFFRRSGRVAVVHVEDGTTVEEGVLIAELDTEGLEIDLRIAEIAVEVADLRLAEAEELVAMNLRNAMIDMEIAQLRLDDARAAQGQGNTSQVAILERALEKSEIALAQTRSEIDPVLQLNLDRAKLNLERIRTGILESRVSAPFSGEVRFINLSNEATQTSITAYEPVARVIDPNSLTIELNLTRDQLSNIQEGMPVVVSALGRMGETTLTGRIVTLPKPFGSGTGPLSFVELDQDAAAVGLVEGSSVEIRVELAQKADTLIIPTEALFGFSGQYYVRVQDGSQQKSVDVKIGIQNESFAEVLSGLTAGQIVVGRE